MCYFVLSFVIFEFVLQEGRGVFLGVYTLWRNELANHAYAIYAQTAGAVANGSVGNSQLAPNAVATPNLQDNSITSPKIASGQVVKSLNGLNDNLTLTTSGSATINSSGNTITISAPVVHTTVLNVTCAGSYNYTTDYSKVSDLGSFYKNDSDSILEVAFHGRVAVISMDSAATAAIFELRVDDAPTSNGYARAPLKSAESGSDGIPVSMTGIFTSLPAGNHSVSMWVQGAYGGGPAAYVDPGCWSSDHLVVKEFK